MCKLSLLCVVLVVVAMLTPTVDSWRRRRRRRHHHHHHISPCRCDFHHHRGYYKRQNQLDDRNCYCIAVDDGDLSQIYKDFVAVSSCKDCDCADNTMVTCGKTCEESVHKWLAGGDTGVPKGTKIRAHAKPDSCSEHISDEIFTAE